MNDLDSILDAAIAASDIDKLVRLVNDDGESIISDNTIADHVRQDYKDTIRFNHTTQKAMIYTGGKFAADETGQVYEMVLSTVKQLEKQVSNFGNGPIDAPARGKLFKAVLKYENFRHRHDALKLFYSKPGIGLQESDFDKDPYVLNLQNGSLNVKTRELKQHSPGDHLSKMAGTIYDPDKDCPEFMDFQNEIHAGNAEIIKFKQRLLGTCLTGDTSAQGLFIAYGSGANGKSTEMRVYEKLLGDYFQTAPSELLMIREARGSTIPADTARLRGIRMAVTSELSEGMRLDEAVVKNLTGGDKIVARALYKEWFEFIPTHKLWVLTNYKPVIRGTNSAIWRRMYLIPYNVTIPPEKRIPMDDLIETFCHELPGILNWALQGLEDFFRNGLQAPEEVMAAVDAYRTENDTIGAFIDECCTLHHSNKVQCKELYKEYSRWAEDNGERPMKNRRFSDQLKERGLSNDKGTGGLFEWRGIMIKNVF